MTNEEIQIAQAAYCVGKMWDEYEGTEDFDRLVGPRVQHLIELVRKSKPSIPSNLDEAAEKSAEKVCGVLLADRFPFIQGFKSGAEWMAGQGVKLKYWIARDECSGDESNLYIGQKKPRRIPETAPGFGMWCDYGEFMALPPDMFPELTYSDEPIEVELIIRKK